MCNLYSMTKNADAIRRLFRIDPERDRTGNLPSMPGIYPDYPAPIVRNGDVGRELAMARWGMPSSSKALMDATKKRAQKLEAKGKPVDFKELLRMEPDGGTTNIRNVNSAHWKRWLDPEHRCLVPFTSFSEYDTIDGKKTPVWFAPDESRPLLGFRPLDQCAQGHGGRDHRRHLRVPHPRAECRGRAGPSQGDPGDLDHERGARRLAARPLGRGQGVAAAASGRGAPDREGRHLQAA
jgi:putative SOS response-associated peptidase YedK